MSPTQSPASEPTRFDPVRPVTLAEIEAARDRIAGTITRTPLVKLELGPDGPDIRLKLENLQPINAYKLRGAANAVALLSDEDRAKGVWTISAGNAGQGVAFAARQAGVPCKVVVIDTAPQAKVDRMRALGAELYPTPFNECWDAMQARAFPGMDGTFVHPFDDHDFIAGNATMGLEILEDCPEVTTVIGAMGGGGLLTALGSALKAKQPGVRVIGAEPETAAPLNKSLNEGGPREFDGWTQSFVDGAGGRSVFPRMWERLTPVIDGSVVVSLEQTRAAMRMMADKSRVIAEGAGALALAAALSGDAMLGTAEGPIVCVVSGGNIDLKKFCELVGG